MSSSLQTVSNVPGPIQSSLLRQLPLPVAALGVVAVLGASVLILWRGRGRGVSRPLAVGLIAGVLVSPYVNLYDLTALVLAAWLILRRHPSRWPRFATLSMYVASFRARIRALVKL